MYIYIYTYFEWFYLQKHVLISTIYNSSNAGDAYDVCDATAVSRLLSAYWGVLIVKSLKRHEQHPFSSDHGKFQLKSSKTFSKTKNLNFLELS